MAFAPLFFALIFASALLVPGQAAAQPARPSYQPGQTFRDCTQCPEMVVVPGGAFMMGAPDDEVGRAVGETPQRRVTIGKFAVGKFDVTRGQWAIFATATKRPTIGGCAWASATRHRPDPDASWRKVDFPQDDDHPVVCITWKDAQDYTAWLSKRTGQKYRLLTEAEWEYAARAGTTTAHYWGPQASHEYANYGEEKCCEGLIQDRDRWMKTSPVGAFPPNAFGLYDMHGNVMQWVQDCMHNLSDGPLDGSAYETAAPLRAGPIVTGNLVGTDACSYRMLRGGDWGNPPRMIRSSSRNYAPGPGSTIEVYSSGGLGLRIARSLRE